MSWIKCYSNKIESVWENAHTIIDLPTSSSRYRSDRHFSEFLTYTMAAKINWHTRRTKKLRHCHPEHMLRCKGEAILRDPELGHWPLTLVDRWIGGLLPLGPSESANCWQSMWWSPPGCRRQRECGHQYRYPSRSDSKCTSRHLFISRHTLVNCVFCGSSWRSLHLTPKSSEIMAKQIANRLLTVYTREKKFLSHQTTTSLTTNYQCKN